MIAGDDKGKTGEVLKVIPKKDAVIVAGCKVAKKAVKPTEENKEGGFGKYRNAYPISLRVHNTTLAGGSQELRFDIPTARKV